ncbi:MAG TPA: PilZ domain-containing protein [Candidatus Dormibacteraeota bacterium]|nr:PilZ domain-containing protein [Candidatus Dormibacteraeota bacterium]
MTLFTPAKEKQPKRRHPRAKIGKTLLVAWQGRGRRDASRARNVCQGGMYIDTTNPANVGETVELFFDAPQGEVHARAIVRSMHPCRGMGVEFVGMDYMARKRLHAMLKGLLVSEETEQEAVSI